MAQGTRWLGTTGMEGNVTNVTLFGCSFEGSIESGYPAPDQMFEKEFTRMRSLTEFTDEQL